MSHNHSFFKTVTSVLSVAFIVSTLTFFFWIMLMMGCTQNHPVAECQDNTLSYIIIGAFNLFN